MNKKLRTQAKHLPQKTTGISKNSLYHDINALAVLCLSTAQCSYCFFTIIHFSDNIFTVPIL